MSAQTPIDPDLLRARLIQAVEPVTPSPDALRTIRAGVRKRKLRLTFGAGAGALLITGGAVAAAIVIGSVGNPQASPVTVVPGQTTGTTAPDAPTPLPTVTATTSAATQTSVLPASAAPPTLTSGSAAPGSAGTAVVAKTPTVGPGPVESTKTTVPAIATTHSAATTSPPGHAAVAHDVDQDGVPDTAVTQHLTGTTARLVVHLAGRTVTSATFPLPSGLGSGAITFASIGNDGRSELLVKVGAADGTAYLLFQYARGEVTEVAAPAGFTRPWLYSGGGGSMRFSFACTGGELVLSKAGPTSMDNFLSGKDKSFTFATWVFQLQDDSLAKVDGHSQAHLTMAAALALGAAAPANRCGAPA